MSTLRDFYLLQDVLLYTLQFLRTVVAGSVYFVLILLSPGHDVVENGVEGRNEEKGEDGGKGPALGLC